jgi:hypothetical protein
VVDAAWLGEHGYSPALRSQYVSAGWLEQPARRLYRRPRTLARPLDEELTWQQIVVSMQTLMALPLAVGGRTALELQGFAHYLSHSVKEVHLYGPERPPTWLDHLPVHVCFRAHNSARLFLVEAKLTGPLSPERPDLKTLDVGQWPMWVSAPERAVLEWLDELPEHESFDQVDALFDGLSTLNPRRLQALLSACRSVKVKRLFFFFADRHQPSWLKYLDKAAVDLGSGKRSLVKGGKLDPTYLITVPEAWHGLS